MKGILTKEQIAFIEKEAQNSIYRTPGVISFAVGAKSPFAIIRITPKGLIFIKGTDDTGFEHINQRHSPSSENIYWVNFTDNKGNIVDKKDILGRKKFRLDNPSSFHPYSIPILSYLSIADQVFSSENVNIEKNKRKDLFDVYDGIVSGLDGKQLEYRLLTYKDSKIVHTLIPLTKEFNKQEKLIVNFARQNPRLIIPINHDDCQIEIPYIDEYQIVRYVIIIRSDPEDETKENWYIQVNSSLGTLIDICHFGSKKKEFEIYSEEYLRELEDIDFSPLVKEIKKIEEQLKPDKNN